MLARMSSALRVQVNGLGWALVWSMQVSMTARDVAMLWTAHRCRQRRVSSENQHSTKFSQDAEVGVGAGAGTGA